MRLSLFLSTFATLAIFAGIVSCVFQENLGGAIVLGLLLFTVSHYQMYFLYKLDYNKQLVLNSKDRLLCKIDRKYWRDIHEAMIIQKIEKEKAEELLHKIVLQGEEENK